MDLDGENTTDNAYLSAVADFDAITEEQKFTTTKKVVLNNNLQIFCLEQHFIKKRYPITN